MLESESAGNNTTREKWKCKNYQAFNFSSLLKFIASNNILLRLRTVES